MVSAALPSFQAKQFLAQLTRRPGVYQFLDEAGQVLYVGKAKNLKNRVSSYFRSQGQTPKTTALVSKIADVQVTVTAGETEALLLEQNLIKSLKPPYNVLLRDDKSYPYIFMSEAAEFPALGLHRGARRKRVSYFGPFPSAASVRQTLNILQKTFKVRQCDDSFFKNRSRPCLQYQINRCLGPCVGLVSAQEYAEAVRHTRMFLEGKDREISDELLVKMDRLATRLQYEEAARIRDQIVHLRKIQEQQHVAGHHGDVDVIAGLVKPIGCCVQVLFIRSGRILGSRSYFPSVKMLASPEELLSAFVPQFYLGDDSQHQIPREIILNADLEDRPLIGRALGDRAQHKVQLKTAVRGDRARWLDIAVSNAEQNLAGNHAVKADHAARLKSLQEILDMEQLPRRLECFDISHSSGEATVASCVVFDDTGPLKSEDILAELAIEDVLLVGIAKGSTRKPGLESLYIAGRSDEVVLAGDAPALHLIQHIRDEAHRFAITSHRQSRGKRRKTSSLENIPGIGAKRRRELLRHFGGLQEITGASADEIAKVPGISAALAREIYASLHDPGSGD